MKTYLGILLACFSLLCAHENKEGSLVCIHGFLGGPWSMHFMAKNFKKEGWDVLNWGYPSREKSIEAHAEELVRVIKELAQDKPNKPIHFVTHSLGGLILRKSLNHPECPFEAKIGKAVLLAPPNRGSSWARYIKKFSLARSIAKQFSGRQLMIESDFDHLGRFPDSMEILVVAGNLGFNPYISKENDGTLAIQETYLHTPHKHIVIRRGHKMIVFSKKAYTLAAQFLEDGSILERSQTLP